MKPTSSTLIKHSHAPSTDTTTTIPFMRQLLTAPPAALKLVIVLLVATILCYASTDTSSAESPPHLLPEVRTDVLMPGQNFLGWVSEPIPVTEVFANVPTARLIYTWDSVAESYRYAIRGIHDSLHALLPGTAFVIYIDSQTPVEWTRSIAPAHGTYHLNQGMNWVAWTGPDGWTLDQVTRGIGTSLKDVQHHGTAPNPADIQNTDEAPRVNRGDALVVTVTRDLNWLQPNFIMPDLIFHDDDSAETKRVLREEMTSVLNFYATRFGIHAPNLTVRNTGSGLAYYLGSTIWLRFSDLAKSGCSLRNTLIHEYFHALQHKLPRGNIWWTPEGFRLQWITEGTAQWAMWEWRHTISAAGPQHECYDLVGPPLTHDELLLPWQLADLPLRALDSTHRGYTDNYSVGQLATTMLAPTGSDRPIEYFRLILSSPSLRGGVNGTWDLYNTPSSSDKLTTAFASVFGVTVEDFYQHYDDWRSSILAKHPDEYSYSYYGHTPAGLPRSGRHQVELSGRVVRQNGTPVVGALVRGRAVGPVDRNVDYDAVPAVTSDSGAFAMLAVPNVDYELSVLLQPGSSKYYGRGSSGCGVWYHEEGSFEMQHGGVFEDTGASVLEGQDGDQSDITIVVPHGLCTDLSTLSVKVVNERGNPIAGLNVSLSKYVKSTLKSQLGREFLWTGYVRGILTDAEGRAEVVNQTKGRYRVTAHLGVGTYGRSYGCEYYGPEFEVPKGARNTEALVVVSDEACSVVIEGTVRLSDGRAAMNAEVVLYEGEVPGRIGVRRVTSETANDVGQFRIVGHGPDVWRWRVLSGMRQFGVVLPGTAERDACHVEPIVQGNAKNLVEIGESGVSRWTLWVPEDKC